MKPSDVTGLMNALDDFLELNNNDPAVDEIVPEMQSLRDRIRIIHNKNISDLHSRAVDLQGRFRSMTGEARLNWFRNWAWTDDDLAVFQAIFMGHIDWQHPCLEIFPGIGQCLPYALGAEPLYVADWDKRVLDHAAGQFNEYYATKRLMSYQIEGFDLSSLPQSSFGFVYALNYLRFEDRQGLNNLARAVWDLLLPGGHYLFAFMATDRYNSMLSIETGYAIGADTEEVKSDLLALGYIVEEVRHKERPCYFLCRKPGELIKNKMTSVLAKIIDRE
jgi:hypothetical protein